MLLPHSEDSPVGRQKSAHSEKVRTLWFALGLAIAVEQRLQELLNSYTPPKWFELEADVLAFCPDLVVHAFMEWKEADDRVWAAEAAHAEAAELNRAEAEVGDPNGALPLRAELDERLKEADRADLVRREASPACHPGTGVTLRRAIRPNTRRQRHVRTFRPSAGDA